MAWELRMVNPLSKFCGFMLGNRATGIQLFRKNSVSVSVCSARSFDMSQFRLVRLRPDITLNP